MLGWHFSKLIPSSELDPFDRLLKLFQEVMIHTSGNVDDAMSWLTELDRVHGLTTPEYGIGDFYADLKEKGWIKEEKTGTTPTAKMEASLRRNALEEIFDQLKKSGKGTRTSNFSGIGDESNNEVRSYEFGDRIDHLALSETLRNAQINHGINDFKLDENDLIIRDTQYETRTSTVLMIDISHSMILYGEDRITPAKKVAMALSELILTRYSKDTLDIIVFGNDAWEIKIKDLPYLEVGPYHTNTVAGLELAMNILKKRKSTNKQIMMITDGKPTCIKKGKKYYQNSFGLDPKIINRTLALAIRCRKQNIPITTFMIARDPYLVQFVDSFTKANNGKAFYSSLEGLGEFIFMDYKNSKRKRRR